MKISLISTIFNEEKTIKNFLDSILVQSKNPDEIVIVDGDSKDASVAIIKNYDERFKKKKTKLKILVKKGNRSVGRNEAIKNATEDVIICSDAGNILDRKWVENIIKPFNDSKVDVVAGYYKSKPQTLFQKCVTPFVLVMEDRIDPDKFLPATRSIAFRKAIWKKVEGFPEEFSHNEDYVFAKRLEKIRAKKVFAKNAIVYWLPRNNFKEAFIMFFRFALGDAEANMFRPKVFLLFVRYTAIIIFLILAILYKSIFGVLTISFFFILYCIWAIIKNYRYVRQLGAILILPLLQFTADASVLSGTAIGLVKRLSIKQFQVLVRGK